MTKRSGCWGGGEAWRSDRPTRLRPAPSSSLTSDHTAQPSQARHSLNNTNNLLMAVRHLHVRCLVLHDVIPQLLYMALLCIHNGRVATSLARRLKSSVISRASAVYGLVYLAYFLLSYSKFSYFLFTSFLQIKPVWAPGGNAPWFICWFLTLYKLFVCLLNFLPSIT